MTAINQPQLQYIDLGIGRMTCDDCVHTVTETLEALAGVKGAAVSLERRSARVAVDQSVEPEQLATAVRATGYSAFLRSRETQA